MNTNRSKLLGGVLALVVAFAGVGFAGATLTMDATDITASGNLAIDGVAASVYTIGATTTSGTITIGGTAQTGAIAIGDTALSTVSEISIGGGDGVKTIHIGDGTGANTILIGGGGGTVAINSGDWDISTTGVMTGIGNITTDGSLVFNGTVTKGINLAGATMTEGTDDALFSIGTVGAPKSVALTTAGFYQPLQVNLLSSANPTSETILSGAYVKVATATDQANMNLVGITARATMGGNVVQAYGVQSHLTISAGQSAGNMTAISGKTILGENTTGGIVSAGLFTVEGNTAATTTSTGYGVWADITNGAQVTSIFEGNVNDANSLAAKGLMLTGAITTGIDMTGTTSTTTGIKIGTATTGLNLNGTYTTGISIPATATTGITSAAPIRVTTAATNYDASALSVGLYGAGLADTTSGDNILASIVSTTATNKTAPDTSSMALYVGNSNSAATANAKLQGILASTAVNNNVFDAYGVQGNVTVADGATSPTNGNIAGLSGKVTFGNAVANAAVSAGYFTLAGGNTGANANGVLIDVTGASTTANSLINASTTSGAAVTTGLVLGGTMTNGINLSGATVSGAGIIMPTQGATVGACTTGGAIVYDGVNHKFMGCDGTNWAALN